MYRNVFQASSRLISNFAMSENILMKTKLTPSNQSITGPVVTSVKSHVRENFPDLKHFEIFNDSYKHMGHAGIAHSSNQQESHLRLELVSDRFKGLSLPNRHRLVYAAISNDMKKYNIHAIQLKTKTIEEFESQQK